MLTGKYTPEELLAIFETFSTKKAAKGTIKFSSSTWADPHIQKIVRIIASARGVSEQDIINHVESKKAEFDSLKAKAPILYGTISQNIIESELFNIFWETDVDVGGPKFKGRTFNTLVRAIRADKPQFFPLRSDIDRRTMMPNVIFHSVDGKGNPIPNDDHGDPRPEYRSVTTAAATPGGDFIFNVPFMQKLMDWAHIKGVKPKGKKYVANGGDIPNEYCYIEFLIMHEFLHYSEDDFYYQKIIPNANPTIINWVGDFRSNYLLVKSGYEQLPMGLFNDDINFDRQSSYIDMYNLVKSEMEKLNDKEKEKVSNQMDSQSDDHEPGQEQGKKSDADTSGKTVEDIDKNSKNIDKNVDNGKEATAEERQEQAKKDQESGQPGPRQREGKKGGGGGDNKVDYTKIVPQYNWKGLVDLFMKKVANKMQETYAKAHRRNVSNLDIARQTGAGAVRPGEIRSDESEALLCFCLDTSGSMLGDIGKVYANVSKLLKQPGFAKTNVVAVKFGSQVQLYKCNIAQNKAAKVASMTDKPKSYDMKATDVFLSAQGGGTEFSQPLRDELKKILKAGYSVLICSDSDLLWDHNLPLLLDTIKFAPKQVFVVFDKRDTYIRFRQMTGISTPTITYF